MVGQVDLSIWVSRRPYPRAPRRRTKRMANRVQICTIETTIVPEDSNRRLESPNVPKASESWRSLQSAPFVRTLAIRASMAGPDPGDRAKHRRVRLQRAGSGRPAATRSSPVTGATRRPSCWVLRPSRHPSRASDRAAGAGLHARGQQARRALVLGRRSPRSNSKSCRSSPSISNSRRPASNCLKLICASNRSTRQITPTGRMSSANATGPAVSRPGDLWLLGKHRVYCGSALDPSAYELLMANERASAMFTDPPTTSKSTATFAAAARSGIESSPWRRAR